MEGLLAFVKEVGSADRDLVDDTCGELVAELVAERDKGCPVRKSGVKVYIFMGAFLNASSERSSSGEK